MKKSQLIAELEAFSSDDFEIVFEHVMPDQNEQAAERVLFQTSSPVLCGGSTENGPTFWITLKNGGES